MTSFLILNHLGTVLTTINDRKIAQDTTADGTYDYWLAAQISGQDYSPGGMVMPERNFSSFIYKIGYQGSLKDDEIKGTGNSYTTFFRELDPRLVRWWSVDPETYNTPWEASYVSMGDNPIKNTDVRGNTVDNEYEPSGKKISSLGGDKIDFFHQNNGDTKIVDRGTGASNIITGGVSLIRGFTLRDNNITWGQITDEFLTETGPVKSLFSDFDNSEQGAFGSLYSSLSTYATKARKNVLSLDLPKNTVSFDYSETNPIKAQDMWEQMWGRTTISWYKLGDKTLFLMADSKSAESLFYREGNSRERSTYSTFGNTYQTYIWVENNEQLSNKVAENSAYYERQIKLLSQEMKIQKF